MSLENRTILVGKVEEQVKLIQSETIDVIISSPPYWSLRDYGIEGQWGLEPDFREYLKKMRDLMHELKRVLKPAGTCWINLGDTYSGGKAHSDWEGSDDKFHSKDRIEEQKFQGQKKDHIEAKSRYGIPERFYTQCIDDGWLARNHIVWYKSNGMPSSVKDRFSNKWESIFFFAKEQRYYFNLDAVREKLKTAPSKPYNVRVRDGPKGKWGSLVTYTDKEVSEHNEKGERKGLGVPGQSPHGIHRRQDKGLSDCDGYGDNKQDHTLGADGQPKKTYVGFNERYKKKIAEGKPVSNARIESRVAEARAAGLDHDACLSNPNGKNPGDAFFINPRPFPEAHFATFPVDLPLKILKCACPPAGFVLDPFFGAGTVGLAAEKLGINWIGIELNPEYVTLARKRLEPYRNGTIIPKL